MRTIAFVILWLCVTIKSYSQQPDFTLPTEPGKYIQIDNMHLSMFCLSKDSPVLSVNNSKSILSEYSVTIKISKYSFQMYVYKNGSLVKGVLFKQGTVVFSQVASQYADQSYEYKYGNGKSVITLNYDKPDVLPASFLLVYFDDSQGLIVGATTVSYK